MDVRKAKILCLVGIVALAAGCTPTPNWRGPQKLDQEYENLLREWTRSAQIYHSLDSILLVHATYLAPEFRTGFKKQYVEIFGIDPGKGDSDLEKISVSADGGHEFFLFADANNTSWNNLDDPESVWRLSLWGGDDQPGVSPTNIHAFKGRGPNLKAFFPYLSRFGRSYLVIFPLDQPGGQPVLDPRNGVLTLKMASAFGTAILSWKVTE